MGERFEEAREAEEREGSVGKGAIAWVSTREREREREREGDGESNDRASE